MCAIRNLIISRCCVTRTYDPILSSYHTTFFGLDFFLFLLFDRVLDYHPPSYEKFNFTAQRGSKRSQSTIMASFVAAMDSGVTTSSEIGQALSGIFGCISLVAWICLLVCHRLYCHCKLRELMIPHSFLNLSPTTRPRAPMPCRWASCSSG